MLNTSLSLGASCAGAYGMSQFLNNGLFKMEDILNATLAGGVVIESCCDLINDPWISLLLGFVIGAYSAFGFNFLTLWLNNLGFYDTYGINNLHGVPGIVSAITSCILLLNATKDAYGESWGLLFPKSVDLKDMRSSSALAYYNLISLLIYY